MRTRSRTASRRSSAKPARFVKRYKRLEDMPIVHRHAAGIDLAGAANHFVAVEIGDEIEVRDFGGTTDEVKALVAYLLDHGVTTVAMEATGVYWMVVYDLLEAAGLEVCLTNPAHAKTVPGRRKDDQLDCRWLQKLHKYGMLSASFRPGLDDRPLHGYYRQRKRLVNLVTDELRRMQKALDVMNVRVHRVISDLDGKTGLRIVRAIVDGEHDPAQLATLRDPRCACSVEELQAALTGHYLPHQCMALKQALQRYDMLVEQIGELDAEIETVLRGLLPLSDAEVETRLAATSAPLPSGKHAPPFAVDQFITWLTGENPTVLPGIGPQLALGILAETGRDLSKWPTVQHFTSYATLAPQLRISGGKLLSSRTRPGMHPLAALFRQAAAAITQTDTALGAYYRRLALRVGSGKALTATARKIAVQYYNLMRFGQEYVEQGAKAYDQRYQQRQLVWIEKKARAMGYTLTAAA